MGTWSEHDSGTTPVVFDLIFEHTNGVRVNVGLASGGPDSAPLTEGTAAAEQVVAAILADTDFSLIVAARQYQADTATYAP